MLEGLQKLIFAEILGSGRFAGIGIPLPGVTGLLAGPGPWSLDRLLFGRAGDSG